MLINLRVLIIKKKRRRKKETKKINLKHVIVSREEWYKSLLFIKINFNLKQKRKLEMYIYYIYLTLAKRKADLTGSEMDKLCGWYTFWFSESMNVCSRSMAYDGYQ